MKKGNEQAYQRIMIEYGKEKFSDNSRQII